MFFACIFIDFVLWKLVGHGIPIHVCELGFGVPLVGFLSNDSILF